MSEGIPISIPAETLRIAQEAIYALEFGLDNDDRLREAVTVVLGKLADIRTLNEPLEAA